MRSLVADWVVVNGRIFTADAAMPWAQAVACRGGHIVAVGSDDEIGELIGGPHQTQVVDVGGRLAAPGLPMPTCT